jgi:hypothetical protein
MKSIQALAIVMWVGALAPLWPTVVKDIYSPPSVEAQYQRDSEIRWYSEKEAKNKHTANGEVFDDQAFTCASRDLPFGTRVRVTYKGKSATFRCNDRAPDYIELTLGGFSYFENPKVGVLRGATIETLK